MQNIEIDFKLYVSDGSMTSFITEGTYEDLGEYRSISFVEDTTIKANTTIDIYQERVLIKRLGEMNMTMEYIMGMDTTLYLTTNFNYDISMNNYTSFLEITEDTINIIYQTQIDKEQNLTHNLFLKWHFIN